MLDPSSPLIDLPQLASVDVACRQIAAVAATRIDAVQIAQIENSSPELRSMTDDCGLAGEMRPRHFVMER